MERKQLQQELQELSLQLRLHGLFGQYVLWRWWFWDLQQLHKQQQQQQ
jgi:hypothetical protein